MFHKFVDCRELLGEGPFDPVFYLWRNPVVRLGIETEEKGVDLPGYADTAIIIRHCRGTIRSVAGTWTHNVTR